MNDDGSLIVDQDNDGCDIYAHNPSFCGLYDNDAFTAADFCCACGGGGDPDDIPVTCQCKCDDDRTCWIGCWECLGDIFGSESEGDDEEEE